MVKLLLEVIDEKEAVFVKINTEFQMGDIPRGYTFQFAKFNLRPPKPEEQDRVYKQAACFVHVGGDEQKFNLYSNW